MIDRPMWLGLKRLGKETVIYGIGTLFSRYLSFLLVPFYSNILPVAEYGIVTNIYAYIALFYIVYYCGMDSAYMKYAGSRERGDEKEAFGAAFLATAVLALLLSLVFFLSRDFLAERFLLAGPQKRIVFYVLGMLLFDSIAVVPFARLRFLGRPVKFVGLKALNVFFNLGLNVILVWRLRRGIEGVFLASLGASFLTWLTLLPGLPRSLSSRLPRELAGSLLKFGLPIVPTRLFLAAMQVIDRPIILALAGATTAGIYEANYRLGSVLLVLVSIFNLAWQPFLLKNAILPEARILFGKIFTFILMASSAVLLVLSLFLENLAKMNVCGFHPLGPNYWSGLGIVPVILAASLLYGFFFSLSAGLLIAKKTHILPLLTFAGAAANISLNVVLIPKYGILGAAWATLLSFLLVDIGVHAASQRAYRIPYEYAKIAKIGLGLPTFLGGYFLIRRYIRIDEFVLKFALCAGYLAYLVFFGLAELKSIRRALLPRKAAP